MTHEELINQANRIAVRSSLYPDGALAEAREFLKNYGGPKNAFESSLDQLNVPADRDYGTRKIQEVLHSYVEYVKNGLLRSLSQEREIQIETVSDYLSQAEDLLNDKKVHPAAPTVIIGASLEEFLRTWLEEKGVDLGSIKMSLDSYANELRKRELISKQDLKDITSWGGTRNDAAHGHWENVEDRNRIRLMLEGVNLFMRKYGK